MVRGAGGWYLPVGEVQPTRPSGVRFGVQPRGWDGGPVGVHVLAVAAVFVLVVAEVWG